MSNYLLGRRLTEEAERSLLSNPAMPLMRELNFKFGLKIWRLSSSRNIIHMAHPSGMAVCNIWHDGEKFHYYSPFFKKSRGSDQTDKSTLSGKTVGLVTGLIKKYNALATEELLTAHHMNALASSRRMVDNSVKYQGKQVRDKDYDVVHALLERAVGENPNGPRYDLDVQECKRLLEEFDATDVARKLQKERTDEIYKSPLWAIGVYHGSSRAIVGKILPKPTEVNFNHFEVLQPFQLVFNLDELMEKFPELTPTILMTKVKSEQENRGSERMCGFFNFGDHYDETIPYVTYYFRMDDFNCCWYFTPAAKEPTNE